MFFLFCSSLVLLSNFYPFFCLISKKQLQEFPKCSFDIKSLAFFGLLLFLLFFVAFFLADPFLFATALLLEAIITKRIFFSNRKAFWDKIRKQTKSCWSFVRINWKTNKQKKTESTLFFERIVPKKFLFVQKGFLRQNEEEKNKTKNWSFFFQKKLDVKQKKKWTKRLDFFQ